MRILPRWIHRPENRRALISFALVCLFGCAAASESPVSENTAGEPEASEEAFLSWNSAQFSELEGRLRAAFDPTQAAHEVVVTGHGYTGLIVLREGRAEGEVHEKMGDLVVVRRGGGSISVGGQLTNRRSMGPNEFHGTLEGATRQHLDTGDIFFVPANVPHQFDVDEGGGLFMEFVKLEADAATPGPAEFMHWGADHLIASDAKLASAIDEQKMSYEDLAASGKFSTFLLHREASAGAEAHEHTAEFHFVRNGEGSMMIGGSLVEPTSSEPGELRGSSIEGGALRALSAGDLVYIPPKTPHQFQAKPGAKYNVLVVKIAE